MTDTHDESLLLTIPEVAERLGCSRMHVYRLIRQGDIGYVDISLPAASKSKMRIERIELERFLLTRKVDQS